MDAHRPWNLGNVFGGFPLEAATDEATTYKSRSPVGVNGGQIGRAYNSTKGGIVVFDDGDIEEELGAQRDAYLALVDIPDMDDDEDDDLESSDGEDEGEDGSGNNIAHAGQKRKSWSDGRDDEDSDDEDRPRQRRRSNSVCDESVAFAIN